MAPGACMLPSCACGRLFFISWHLPVITTYCAFCTCGRINLHNLTKCTSTQDAKEGLPTLIRLNSLIYHLRDYDPSLAIPLIEGFTFGFKRHSTAVPHTFNVSNHSSVTDKSRHCGTETSRRDKSWPCGRTF